MKLRESFSTDELLSFVGNSVAITFEDNETLIGKIVGYTVEADSEDGAIHVFLRSEKRGVDIAEYEIKALETVRD